MRGGFHCLLLIMLLFAISPAQATTVTITSGSGNWSVPANVTSVTVQVWGGGGAGGGNPTASDGGGGGGGGGYSTATIAVSGSVAYSVGVGGTPVAGNNGGNGGNTSFGAVSANGGTGGAAPVGGNGGVRGTGGAGTFSGGNGGTGRNNGTGRGGPGGSSAGTAANGTSGPATWSTRTAAAAPAGGGIGGNGGNTGQDGFAPASGYGGGGGGSGDVATRSGGAGAGGQIIITYKTNQTITVTTPAPASAAYNSQFTVAATASSGFAVAYSSGSPAVCTNSGATFTMIAPTGTCIVQYDQAGDANDWNAAPQVTNNVTATKADQTISVTTPAPASAAYNSQFTVAATASSGFAVAYSSGSPAVCTNSSTTFTVIAPTGTCIVQYNQPGDTNYNAAPQVTNNVAATKVNQTITFGAQASQTFTPGGTFSLSPVATATSGLAIAYSATTPGVCTIAGTTVTMAAAGNCTIAADQAGDSNWNPAPQVTQNISILGVANKLGFFQQPSNTEVNVTINPPVTVRILDATDNLIATDTRTVTVAKNVCGGTLNGTTSVAAVAGVASFSNLSINAAGTACTLTATSSPVLTPDTSVAFNITLPASQLAFGTQPSDSAPNTAIDPPVTVEIRDSSNNLVTSSTAAVTLALGANPGSGTLSGTLTVNAVSGVATFSDLSIDSLGTGYTLTATSGGLTGATSGAFDILGATSTFGTSGTWTAPPGVTAVTVEVWGGGGAGGSATGNPAKGGGGGGGQYAKKLVTVVPGTGYPYVVGGGGTGGAGAGPAGGDSTFSTPSPLTAVVVAKGGAGGTSGTVNGGTANGGTGSTTGGIGDIVRAGGNGSDGVGATQPAGIGGAGGGGAGSTGAGGNASGNTAGAGTPVGGGSGAAARTTSGACTNAASVAGGGGCGGYALTATNRNGGSGAAGQIKITYALVATKLAFAQQPGNTVAGATIAPAVTVQIQDAAGTLVTSSTAAVTLAIGTNPGGGTLSGTVTVNAVGGVATFSNLSINNVGTGYTLAATSSGLTGATSNTFNITAGAASKLAFYQQPSNTTVGTAISPAVTVQIQDADGNLVTSDTRTVTLTKNVCGGTLGGTTSLAAVGGVATFSNLTISAVGTGCTLTAASTPSLTTDTSSAFNVTALPATQVVFTVQPSNAAPNVAISPAIKLEIRDSSGAVVTTSSAIVTLAIGTNPGSGTLAGTTSVAAVNGVVTFSNLSINSIGAGYTLVATSSGLTGATSTAFNITSATKLAFFQQPSNTSAASAITPAVTVQIRDASNNLVTTSTDTVTVAIGNNAGPGGVLSGSLSVAAVGGVATFSNLSINVAGNGYTLTASAPGLTGDTSVSFNITPLVCYTDNFADLTNWSVGNEGGTFGNPIATANRLRMTNATTVASTYATLQRLFPAFGNKVIVEFLHYAYGGTATGADGIGVILSDAAQAPVAGAFGGSLGYAPKRTDQGGDTTHPGFVGGWLGVGIDEWGNYSNNTEGRTGGAAPGFTPQSVGVRGSGTGYTGYSYLTGTGSSPGGKGIDLDFATQTHLATLGPGYKYRIIIDHSDAVHAYTSVERDLMQGGGYVYLVPPFDAKTQPGQSEVPTNWFLSIAGATGAATNIHEIANLSVCSNSQSTIALDHIEIVHDGSGFPGIAESITIKACADTSCSTLYLSSVTFDLSTIADVTWSTDPITFTGGQTTLTLTKAASGTVTLGGSATTPIAINPTTCFIGATASCQMVFSTVTFDAVQTGAARATPIFTKLSGIDFSLDVLAVTAGAINTGFTGEVTVDLVDPTAASGNCTDTNVGLTNATAYTFTSPGDNGRHAFTFNYPYAALNAKVRIRFGGNVYCSSDNFVIRPQVLTLSTSSNITNPQGTPSPPTTLAAGADFNLTVNAGVTSGYVWSIPVKDPTLANIRDQNNTAIVSGSLTGNFNAGTGTSASGTFQYQDVGTINFLTNAVIDSAFFNQDQHTGVYGGIDHGVNGDCVFNSASNTIDGNGRYGCNIGSTPLGPLGRFIPDHFTLTVGSVTAACNGFTYMGQPFGIAYTLEARNTSDVRTQKYTTATPPYAPVPTPVLVAEEGTFPGIDMASRISGLPATNWVAGQYILSTGAAVFSRPDTPVALDTTSPATITSTLPNAGGPFDTLTLGVRMVDGNAVIANRNINASTSTDCATNNDCDAKQLLTGNPTKMRFGILQLDGATSSEMLDVRVPVRVLYLGVAPAQFVVNTLDSCTTIAQANISLGNQKTPLTSANFGASHRPVTTALTNGVGTMIFTKPSPSATGSADMAVNLGSTTADASCVTWSPSAPATTGAIKSWLRGNWCGAAGFVRDPNARITFGINKSIFIYLREKY